MSVPRGLDRTQIVKIMAYKTATPAVIMPRSGIERVSMFKMVNKYLYFIFRETVSFILNEFAKN